MFGIVGEKKFVSIAELFVVTLVVVEFGVILFNRKKAVGSAKASPENNIENNIFLYPKGILYFFASE